MPEPPSTKSSSCSRGRRRAELTTGGRKLLHVERYLDRQARNAHMLGVRDLEVFYSVGYLALRLWHMEGWQ